MARGMAVPECVFCLNYRRQGRDALVRPEDVHICVRHNFIIPWEGARLYVCNDFFFDGAETGVPGNVHVSCPKDGVLYSLESEYSELATVAPFSELQTWRSR